MTVLRVVLVRCNGSDERCHLQLTNELTPASDLPASAREAREIMRKTGWVRTYPPKGGGDSRDLCPACAEAEGLLPSS